MELLAVRALSKQFAKVSAVKEISFSITAGHCVSLLGPNGAGKTTTLQMLTGLLKPTSGTIAFAINTQGDWRQQMGYLPQYPTFYNWMTGQEFLDYVGKLAHMSTKALKVRSAEMLQLVGLTDAGNRKIGGYSGGMKQRLGIAQALIHSPQLLLLDEPVSALDPLGRREVLDLLNRIKKETTLLFSTHVLHDAQEICDDVIIMRAGEIIVSGVLEEILQQYQQPLITIRAAQSLENWSKEIAKLNFIEHVACQGATANLTIKENRMDEARAYILADWNTRELAMLQFEIVQPSLEDIFIQVVRG